MCRSNARDLERAWWEEQALLQKGDDIASLCLQRDWKVLEEEGGIVLYVCIFLGRPSGFLNIACAIGNAPTPNVTPRIIWRRS